MNDPAIDSPTSRTVLKFGGTSVADLDSWRTIADILRRHGGGGGADRLLVVHSALPGVTDALEVLADPGGHPREDPRATAEALLERHRAFGRELLGRVPDEVEGELEELRRLAEGVRLVGEATPRTRARILSFGERIATRIGAAFLRAEGLPVEWLDAHELLEAMDNGSRDAATRWLSAQCDPSLDSEVRARLDALPGIGLTQGFTARSREGDTVVLGRGGSDTSAAYLAGRWGADRLEIWSDVPGMFSADPRRIPTARLLRTLSYGEAQEIATTGSRVVHPRCIRAVREREIPLFLKSTRLPEMEGTQIVPRPADGSPSLKAISWKSGVILVSMETLGMWQEVGFLARAFEVFRAADLSVDLVSTSETNVTVSLDADANLLQDARLEEVAERLGKFCRVEIIRPCAAVSLVGNRIRALLHRLAPALEVFEEHRIHMLSQAANDLNFTVVVDEEEGERLARQLHRTLVSQPASPRLFGPSWEELVTDDPAERTQTWWEDSRERLLELMDGEDAAYVYHLDTVRHRVKALRELAGVDRVLFAMKANFNPEVLGAALEAGAGFECVSRGEVEAVLDLFPELARERILFTPNFAPREEYQYALEQGVRVTLDALHPIQHWPELFRDRELFVRVDPGEGAGHHEKVSTAGWRSKFGIPPSEMDELETRLGAVGAKVVGLHVHAGSGVPSQDHWARTGRFLLAMAERFPDVQVLDLGGGLPIPQRPGEVPIDLSAVGAGLEELRAARPGIEIWLEPGRFVVGEAGVLLARVTQTKGKGEARYVGVATGMNSLIRPTLYGAFHEIVNLTRLHEPRTERVQVVGPICETGDRLGMDRLLPPTGEGDVLLIATAGAYGRAMASSYNLRPPAREIVIP
ncbi:MAG: bifunctional aspartate kinase/diaminopimelate decarboxylase [Gemmatimonadota bacterium]